MDELLRLFPGLTDLQISQFEVLGRLYPEWNEKINVISRRDIDALYPHHIIHSLAISKFFTPAPGTRFVDLGTGGGFPGIPLAILRSDCTFHLIDRIGKKVKVAQEIAEAIGLKNVTFRHGDSGECREKFDFCVSRAVMQLDELVKASAHLIARGNSSPVPNGLICLKGGDLKAELGRVKRPMIEVPLSDYFSDPYFGEKYLIYVEF